MLLHNLAVLLEVFQVSSGLGTTEHNVEILHRAKKFRCQLVDRLRPSPCANLKQYLQPLVVMANQLLATRPQCGEGLSMTRVNQ